MGKLKNGEDPGSLSSLSESAQGSSYVKNILKPLLELEGGGETFSKREVEKILLEGKEYMESLTVEGYSTDSDPFYKVVSELLRDINILSKRELLEKKEEVRNLLDSSQCKTGGASCHEQG